MRRDLEVVAGAALRLAVRALVRLVGRLVLREPQVVVGPEHVERPELAELVAQFQGGAFHDLFEGLLVGLPERLRVVGLEPLVEVDRLRSESP